MLNDEKMTLRTTQSKFTDDQLPVKRQPIYALRTIDEGTLCGGTRLKYTDGIIARKLN